VQPRKRFLLSGAPSAAQIGAADTGKTVRNKTGGNTGNVLITHSLLAALQYDTVSPLRGNIQSGFEELREQHDLIVFPASNFLNRSCDFGALAKIVEQLQLPCLVGGLGAQSNDERNPRIPLKPGTRRLIDLMAERSHKLGVRGEYTAAVLAEMGIHNVEIIGCPSFYASCSPEFFALRKVPDEQLRRIAINGSRTVAGLSFDRKRMAAVETALVKAAMNYDSIFIAQAEPEEITLALDPASVSDSDLAGLTNYYADIPASEIISFFRRNIRVHADIDQWRASLKTFDFVIGTRFHGALIALQAGVPAMLLAHDTRTLEMARLFALPHRRIDDPVAFSRKRNRWSALRDRFSGKKDDKPMIDIRALYRETDFAPTAEAYARLYPKYKAFLEGAGVAHNLA